MPLSPNALAEATEMRGRSVSWEKIGRAVGISPYTIRCELDPAYQQRCVDTVRKNRGSESMGETLKRLRHAQHQSAAMRAKRRDSTVSTGKHESPLQLGLTDREGGNFKVPPSVLADRERRKLIEPASITAALMGDPPTGRSALDMRKPRLVVSNPEKWQCSDA